MELFDSNICLLCLPIIDKNKNIKNCWAEHKPVTRNMCSNIICFGQCHCWDENILLNKIHPKVFNKCQEIYKKDIKTNIEISKANENAFKNAREILLKLGIVNKMHEQQRNSKRLLRNNTLKLLLN